jgi:PAS domain S-box-containing protein
MQLLSMNKNEAARLEALARYEILHTPEEKDFDDLTALAARICGTPIALVDIVDASRLWFKSKVGVPVREIPRVESSFCHHAIRQPDELLIVPDALQDDRFCCSPVVIYAPYIRFYAGAPLVTPDGFALGTLCVWDTVPRDLNPEQIEALRILSHQVMTQFELRLNLAKLSKKRLTGWDRDVRAEQATVRDRQQAEQHQAVQYAITRILSESATAEVAIQNIIKAICETLGWDLGEVWTPEEGESTQVLICTNLWMSRSIELPNFIVQTGEITFKLGEGLSGRIWESGSPQWIADVLNDDNFLRVESARKDGLHGAFGFPIKGDKNVLCVMNFFSKYVLEADLELLDKMADIGCQIGQFIQRKQAELKLEQTQEILQAIMDNSTAMIFVKDIDGRFQFINRRFENIFNITNAEIQGKTNRDLFPEELANTVRQNDIKVLTSGVPLEIEEVVAQGDELHTYLSVKFPLKDPLTNRPYAVCGISTDITFRKQLEESLQEIMQLQQAILNSANYGIVSTNSEGIIQTFNPAAEQMLGYSAEEVLGKTTLALFHDPGEMVQRAKILSQELGSKIDPGYEIFVAKARQGIADENEWTYIRKDGSRFPVRLSVTALRDQAGKITGFLGIASDITLAKQAEAALKESEERYRDLFENANDLIQSVAPNGRFLYVNQAWKKTLGYNCAEVANLTLSDIIHPDCQAHCMEIFGRVMRGEKLDRIEAQFMTKDGAKICVEGGINCKFVDGKAVITRAIFRDVTERKRLEAERQDRENRLFKQREALMELSRCKPLYSGDLASAWWEIVERATRTLGVERASVWLYNEGRSQIRCVDLYQASQNLHTAGVVLAAIDYPIYFQALQADRAIAADNAHTDPRTQEFSLPYLTPLGITSMLDAPIRVGGQTVGVLCLEHVGMPKQWGLEEQNFASYLAYMASLAIEAHARKSAEQALRIEQEKVEQLLLNVLPPPIVSRLKHQQSSIADSFPEATVLFADIVGFTKIADLISPTTLVDLLNDIFSSFDLLTQKYGLEKIKTIGDAYMVAGGIPTPRSDHAEAIALLALDMQQAIARFNTQRGEDFNIRIGIHTGPVVAGVIGIKKFIYDLWGDTVNTASRMESHGIPGCIQVSETTYQILRDKFLFEQRGAIDVKGKGQMQTYFLKCRKYHPV